MLDRIDARIDAGECVALMGPSGWQIDSDEHYRSGSAHVGRLSVLVVRSGD